MSFLTDLKTKMSLDDSDWKKSLESIKQIEKEYYVEAKKNTEKLEALKTDLYKKELKQQKEISKINSQIALQEQKYQSLLESGNDKEARQIKKNIALLNKQRISKEKIASINSKSIKSEIKSINLMNSAQNEGMKYVALRKKRLEELNKTTTTTNTTIGKQTKATRSLANETIRYLRWAGTIAGVVYAANRAWKATLGTGIEVSKMVESNTYGIAALTASNARMIDGVGNALTPMQKFEMAQARSAETMKLLRKEALLTPATFSQLTKVYQQAIGQTLAVTDSFGGSISEVEKNTVKLAQRFTNIAGSIGMPMERVTEEIRSSLTGNVSTDSIISTMIFGSPTEANEAVREARKRTNGLVELYDEVLSPFDVLAKTKSYEKGFLAMQGAWENMMADMVQKSGAFKDITNAFYDMAESLNSGSSEIVENFDKAYNIAGELAGSIGRIGIGIGAIRVAAMVNPFTAWLVAITSIVGALQDVSEELSKDRFSKGVSGSIDESSGGIGVNSSSSEIEKAMNSYERQIKARAKIMSSSKEDTEIFRRQLEAITKINDEMIRLGEIQDGTTSKKTDLEKRIQQAKEATELIAKLALDKEVIELSEKAIEKNKSKTLKLEEDRKKITNDIAINEEKLAKELKRQIPQQVAINELAKTINLEKKAESEISSQISKIKLDAKQKEVKAEQELWVSIQKNLGIEATQKEIIEFKLNALGEQLAIEDDIIERKLLQKKIQEEVYKYDNVKEKSKWGKGQDQFIGLFDENAEFGKKDKTKIDPITLEIKMKGFDEVSSAIAGIGNGMQDLMHINREYEKDLEKINKSKLTYIEYEEQTEKATKKNAIASIGAYANMSGAVASFYDEDDKRKKEQLEVSKVLQATQMAMQISEMAQSTAFTSLFVANEGVKAQAAGTTAVAVAAQSSPWTGFATAAAMAAMLASIGIAIGGSGSISGGISEKDQAINVQESETDLILDRLDRQIELLEQLNQAGTAGVARIEYSKLSYESEVDAVSRKIAEDFTRNTGSTSEIAGATKSVYETKYDEMLNALGFDVFQSADKYGYKIRADEVYGDTEKTFDFIVYFNENRDVFNSLMSNMEDDLNRWINDAQQAIADYTTATLESLSELTDASEKFKEISDSISMSDFYESQDLQKATEDVNKILSESGATDLSDYLNNYITEIDALSEYFTDETYSLLMSQNISDLSAQTEKVNELNELLGTTYITTAEDALNYIDSIELVGDALATSNENIKSWEDGFKSDYEIAQDLARSFNVTLATSYSELDNLFDSLKGGIEGLSDAELELLNANKALIEESAQAINDAFLGAYSPLDQRQKADYAALVASNPEDYNISAIDASYLALQESAKVATRDEDIVTQFNDYTSLLLEQTEEDASRTDIVNGIRENGTTLNDIVDRLERIEEANVNL